MRRWLLVVLFVLVAGVVAPSALAGPERVVRGQLYRVGARGEKYLAPNVPVRLTHPRYGPSTFAYSGRDGMYYLYNVRPGDYVLEVWLSNDASQALRFAVRVLDRPVTDVPPIRVP